MEVLVWFDENMIQNYIDDLIIKYSIEGTTFIINEVDSMEISKCIQIINKYAYLPTTDNSFVKIQLES